MTPTRFVRTLLGIVMSATLLVAAPSPVEAQEEARVLFERANEHLARGLRARGRARERELGQALDDYLAVLRAGTRTRNVVFNLGLTLEELGRPEEAFNYYSEYLRTFDLSEDERTEGARRLDGLRPRVAVLVIGSTPEGAAVRIDRRDLPVRGTTPLELAVPAGEHRVFLEREGFEALEASASATVGASASIEPALTPRPVSVQVIAPEQGTLTLDGEVIVAGRAIPVAPGPHVVRLEMAGAPPVERRFEVPAGGDPMVLELSASAPRSSAQLALTVSRPADVFLDGVRVGSGDRLALPLSFGPHRLRVEAPGHNALAHELSYTGQPLALEVTLGREADATGLHVARALTGIPAAIGLIGGVVLGTVGAAQSASWDSSLGDERENVLIDWANDIDALLLAADITLGITAALGIAAIVLIAVSPGEGEASTVEVVAAPTAGGGTLMARVRFGDAQ